MNNPTPKGTDPVITLPDGTQKLLSKLDTKKPAEADAYYDYWLPIWEAEFDSERAAKLEADSPVEKSKSASEPVAVVAPISATERNRKEAEALEKEVAKLRSELDGEFTGDTYRELAAKTDELTDLKDRMRREEAFKSNQRRRFLANSFGTAADFERLWDTTLRDAALQDELREVANLRRIRESHTMYSSF